MKRNATSKPFFSAEQMVAALASAPDTAVQDASNPGTHAADWDNAIVRWRGNTASASMINGACALRGRRGMLVRLILLIPIEEIAMKREIPLKQGLLEGRGSIIPVSIIPVVGGGAFC